MSKYLICPPFVHFKYFICLFVHLYQLPIAFRDHYIFVYGTSREIYSCTSFACKGVWLGLGGVVYSRGVALVVVVVVDGVDC